MSPNPEDKPVASMLDAEREQLRKAGYTDAEVSQILVARALNAPQQPAGGAGQGVMSNVLSSIVAVGSHARALIPTFRKDVATVFDGTATASARAGATASLAVKAVVILVLGYAAWQEWNQHIISATEIAQQQARKIRVETDAIAQKPMRFCEISNTCQDGSTDLTGIDGDDPIWCYRGNDAHFAACKKRDARLVLLNQRQTNGTITASEIAERDALIRWEKAHTFGIANRQ
jgi:hypothetical protein